MKRKIILAFVTLLLALVGIWVWRAKLQNDHRKDQRGDSVARAANRSQSPTASSGTHTAIPQPRLFKATRYPPVTPEEKAMWEWWNAMDKADMKFQWKMPIEFYGKVTDQFGESVSAATVQLTWTAIDDSHQIEIESDTNGNFRFAGVRGKRLGVAIRKVGYLPTGQSGGGFEYANFFEEQFHVPDKEHPVVFRLQKLLGAEPVYVFRSEAVSRPDGAPVKLRIPNGKFDGVGDLAFSVELGTERTDFGPAYTIRVIGVNGTQLLATTEEFPFLAPEEGYQNSLVLEQPATREGYQTSRNLKFYVRLTGGRYAFVGMEVALLSQGTEVRYSGGVRYNEKWSRNLEFDHRKWINR